jgi:hypothetical protein
MAAERQTLYEAVITLCMSHVLLCRGLVRQLSIDQLDNEGRRVSIYDKGTPEGKTPLFQRTVSMPGVHKRVINELLRPRQWKPNHEDRRFMLQVRWIHVVGGCLHVVLQLAGRCSPGKDEGFTAANPDIVSGRTSQLLAMTWVVALENKIKYVC